MAYDEADDAIDANYRHYWIKSWYKQWCKREQNIVNYRHYIISNLDNIIYDIYYKSKVCMFKFKQIEVYLVNFHGL